jgi:hypothetical protein
MNGLPSQERAAVPGVGLLREAYQAASRRPGPCYAFVAEGSGHLSPFAPTYLPADTASMAPNPTTWTIYKIGKEAARLGTVEAVDAADAVKKAAEEFKTDT